MMEDAKWSEQERIRRREQHEEAVAREEARHKESDESAGFIEYV